MRDETSVRPRRRHLARGGAAGCAALLLAASCGKGSSSSPPAVVLQPNARVLDAAAAGALTAYDFTSGVIQLSSLAGSLAALSPGDVIGTSPTPAAPHGFLRKVVSLAPAAGGGVTVQTTQARLDEAIKNGSLAQKFSLDPSHAHLTALQSGVGPLQPLGRALVAGEPRSGAGSGSSGFDIPVSLTVSDMGSNLTINGDVAFFAGLDVGASVDMFCGVDGNPCLGFRAVAELVDNASVQIQGTIAAQLSKSIPIATLDFDPITFFIGPWPVVLVPQLTVSLNLSGTAQVSFSYSASAAGPQFAYGAVWDSSNGWQPQDSSSGPTYSSALQNLNAQLTVAAKVPVQFEVLLYDVVGPIFTVSFGLDALYQIPHDPVWEIDGTVEADFGITLSLPILGSMGTFQTALLKDKVVIAKAPNTPPQITIVAPANGGFVSTALPDDGLVYLQATTFDDEDGPNCCTVTWSATNGGATATGATNTLVLTVPGTYTVTGTAADSGGLTTSASVTITAGAPPVAARVLLPNTDCANRLLTGIPTLLEADPGPGLTGLPFSCTFTSDDPNDTQFPLTVDQNHTTTYTQCEPGSAGCCQAEVTFDTAGPRNVTVAVTQYAADLVTPTGTGTAQQAVTVTTPAIGPQPDLFAPGPTSCTHQSLGEFSGSLTLWAWVYGGQAPVTTAWSFQPPASGCPAVPFTPSYVPATVCLIGQPCPAQYVVAGPAIAALGTAACPALSPAGQYGTLRYTATDANGATGTDFFWLALFNDTVL